MNLAKELRATTDFVHDSAKRAAEKYFQTQLKDLPFRLKDQATKGKHHFTILVGISTYDGEWDFHFDSRGHSHMEYWDTRVLNWATENGFRTTHTIGTNANCDTYTLIFLEW